MKTVIASVAGIRYLDVEFDSKYQKFVIQHEYVKLFALPHPQPGDARNKTICKWLCAVTNIPDKFNERNFNHTFLTEKEIAMKQTDCSQCGRRDFLKLASAAGIAAGLGALPAFATTEKIVPNMKVVAVIDQSKCNKKAICIKKCPFKAIVKTGDKTNPVYQVIPKKCVGCGCCVKSCPSKAIALVDRKSATSGSVKK